MIDTQKQDMGVMDAITTVLEETIRKGGYGLMMGPLRTSLSIITVFLPVCCATGVYRSAAFLSSITMAAWSEEIGKAGTTTVMAARTCKK